HGPLQPNRAHSRTAQTVLDAAYRVHPERFVRQAPKPATVPTEVWINKPLKTDENTHLDSLCGHQRIA
ncbi:MAG TPA: hypothetical protein VNE63_14935, partial [Candidatus Acidoferrales bacterium]|nr:hypothetical protein [Candidatus Acidoferrales bacterium]